MIGLVPLALTSTFTATLRGVGHTRVAMVYNLMANLVNVVLNYLLINGHYGFPAWNWLVHHGDDHGQTVAFGLALRVVLKETTTCICASKAVSRFSGIMCATL